MKNNTIMEVDINKFYNNINKIKEYVGKKEIMPIIKANAYGTYLNKRLDVVNKFNIVAVAKVEEAIELRQLGYHKEIFILNQPSITELKEIKDYNLTIGLSEKEFLNKINLPVKVHLEIETGMNRTGIKLNDLEEYINIIKTNPNITVEGVYTHLSCADNDEEYTNKQLELFKKAVEIVKNNFNIKYIHSSASNGLINYDDTVSNLVRPGIIMYGYESFKGSREIINVVPITKLKTKITYIKDLDPNESVSYGRHFISNKKMKVATIPIGYADGFRRNLSNTGEVIINNKKCQILGSICMDSCMVDITDIDAKVGDEVYIWDNNIITVEEIAEKCSTINYEILSTISSRVQRVFQEREIL